MCGTERARDDSAVGRQGKKKHKKINDSLIWDEAWVLCALVQIQKAHLIKWKLKHELFHLIVN